MKIRFWILGIILSSIFSGIGFASDPAVQINDKPFRDYVAKCGEDPVNYVVDKTDKYQIVMVGESHWVREQLLFFNDVLRTCCRKKKIKYLLLAV